MAFRHGRFAEITVGGADMSDFCDSADLNIDIDTAETTVFGVDWKQFTGGTAGGQLQATGSYDPTATTGPEAIIEAMIAAQLASGDPTAIVLYPGGNVAGQRVRSFDAFLSNYTESASVGDKVGFSYSLQVTGEITMGAVSA